MTPARLAEIVGVLQETLEKHEAQQQRLLAAGEEEKQQ